MAPYLYSHDRPPWANPTGLINDFSSLIFSRYPRYREVDRLLKEAGARGVSLSGTGSAIYGVFEDQDEALRTMERLKGFLREGKIYLARNLC